jgi:polo-like kinase 1
MLFTDRVGNYGTSQAARVGAAPISTKENPKPMTATNNYIPEIPATKVQTLMTKKDSESSAFPGPNVWVKKWVDYSSKYGLGYMLSNGCSGVFFNDSTKVVLDLNAHDFYYYERKTVASGEK